jgi:hypothetical protein
VRRRPLTGYLKSTPARSAILTEGLLQPSNGGDGEVLSSRSARRVEHRAKGLLVAVLGRPRLDAGDRLESGEVLREVLYSQLGEVEVPVRVRG